MYTHQSLYPAGTGNTIQKGRHLTLLTDLSREPVFLQGRVIVGPAFAAAMIVLGKVVTSSAVSGPKDHSAYQEWVFSKYLDEIDNKKGELLKGLPDLKVRESELRSRIKEIEKEIEEISQKINPYNDLKKFYSWLYDHNHEAWIVIDPIVSVQSDATFFEGFSKDKSVYVQVKLPNDKIDLTEEIQTGTTNIDYSLSLEKEFSRIRSYRPLNLAIGSKSVSIKTDIGSAKEKKIDLPETWVKGLLEVQSILTITPISFNVSSTFVSDIIARLESEKEKNGPRSLRFQLEPSQPVKVVIEPWDEQIIDVGSSYEGKVPKEIRIWGRRRLFLLKDILPDSSSVKVDLIDSGMPSFWSVVVDGVELKLGLSGWNNLDWVNRVRFSAFIPNENISNDQLTKIAAILKSNGYIKPNEISAQEGIEKSKILSILKKLCLMGKAMYDGQKQIFRWRELYPEFQYENVNPESLEERKGIDLKNSVIVEEKVTSGRVTKKIALVDDGSVQKQTKLEFDEDGLVIYAECSCSYFRYHKLRQGPCRHIIAASLN